MAGEVEGRLILKKYIDPKILSNALRKENERARKAGAHFSWWALSKSIPEKLLLDEDAG